MSHRPGFRGRVDVLPGGTVPTVENPEGSDVLVWPGPGSTYDGHSSHNEHSGKLGLEIYTEQLF